MNADFRVSVDFFTHHKTKKLKRKLGSDAVICLMSLWAYASKQRTDGNLYDMTAEDIEIAVDWGGEEGGFVEALLDIGFLDQSDEGFVLHDWEENNPWVAESKARSDKAKAAAAKRWDKKDDAPKCPGNARAMPEHASSNAPSPSPSPSPIPTPTEIDSPSMPPPLEASHSMPDKPTCPPVRCPANPPREIRQLFEPEEPVPKPEGPLKTSNEQTDEANNHGKSTKSKRATGIADNWSPSDKDRTFAIEDGIDENRIDRLVAQFRDHHTAKGTVSKDWAASWRTWVRKDVEWNGSGSQRQAHGNASKRNGAPSPSITEITERLMADAYLQDGGDG